MPAEPDTIKRVMHIRFRSPVSDPMPSLQVMMQAMQPFLATLGETKMRLFRNADDPARFVQTIEYQADRGFEANRQKFASDPAWQMGLQMWRTLFPAGMEFEIYEEVLENAA
ncbi:MAG: hypothetical protein AB7K04_05135 [Pseudorhodoplanes sp.]